MEIAGSLETPDTFPFITLHTCAFEQRSSAATSAIVRISSATFIKVAPIRTSSCKTCFWPPTRRGAIAPARKPHPATMPVTLPSPPFLRFAREKLFTIPVMKEPKALLRIFSSSASSAAVFAFGGSTSTIST